MSSPSTGPEAAARVDSRQIRHLHLDPLGGIAGDMFIAAMLDLLPELETPVVAAIRAVGLPADWRVELASGVNGGIAGHRLRIAGPAQGHRHPIGRYPEIRARFDAAALPDAVRERALDILDRLAMAEAGVHGIPPAEVHFHELADWDSVADIAGAAAVIAALPDAGWSMAPLPLGSGQVRTAHGLLPVPAPATARLIEGLPVHDDGIAGERVTPTGAAILASLRPQVLPGTTQRLAGTGYGLGTRRLDGIANVLRVTAFTAAAASSARERIGVIRFEVDDQTPEDLAIALAHVAARAGVRDVCQWPAYGKKGRIAIAVQVLCAPEAIEEVADACLNETTTIGLRLRLEDRRTLPRHLTASEPDGRPVGVKTVERPDGRRTAKAEADGLAATAGHAARAALRARATEQP